MGTQYTITLQVINGCIVPKPGPYQTGMKADADTAVFVNDASVPPLSRLDVVFTPLDVLDGHGNHVLDVPFEKSTITNPPPGHPYPVQKSCKSMMAPNATTADGRVLHCKWDERGNVTGATVCTGGGNNPVHC